MPEDFIAKFIYLAIYNCRKSSRNHSQWNHWKHYCNHCKKNDHWRTAVL